MVTRGKRQDKQHSALWSLLRAIASYDKTRARQLLDTSPELASEAMPVGASRASSTPYFLNDIKHHVYAGHTALHVAAAAHRTDLARYLVTKGADVAAANRRGAQPLHYAAVGMPGCGLWKPQAT